MVNGSWLKDGWRPGPGLGATVPPQPDRSINNHEIAIDTKRYATEYKHKCYNSFLFRSAKPVLQNSACIKMAGSADAQSDEADMGMSYAELGDLGHCRKVEHIGPKWVQRGTC